MPEPKMVIRVVLWDDNIGGGYTCTWDGQNEEKFTLFLTKEQAQLICRRLEAQSRQPKGTHLHISLALTEVPAVQRDEEDEKIIASGGTTYSSPPLQ